jgi:O-antigen/teichoic acid export membrane protein
VFGAQQAVSMLLMQSRGALEGLVLPAAAGYGAIGLLNRARALFALAADRPRGIVAEVAYPFLPRSAGDPERFARHALLFARGMLLLIVSAACFVVIEGPSLSRLLYGDRWLAADALIAPAAVAGAALGLSSVCSSVLLGADRLRRCATVDAAGALLSIPALGMVLARHDIATYAWVLAAGQVAGAAVALGAAGPLMPSGWLRTVLAPPAVGSAIAAAAVLAARAMWLDGAPPLASVLVETAIYAVGLLMALRALFPRALRIALDQFPGGDRLVA